MQNIAAPEVKHMKATAAKAQTSSEAAVLSARGISIFLFIFIDRTWDKNPGKRQTEKFLRRFARSDGSKHRVLLLRRWIRDGDRTRRQQEFVLCGSRAGWEKTK